MKITLTKLQRACAAELLGTFLLVFFGTGSVASAVSSGALQGLWQIAAVWGFGVALSIYATAGVSGAHLNPAVSTTLAIFRKFPKAHVLPYVASQVFGSMLAGLAVLGVYGSQIKDFEVDLGIERSAGNANLTLSGKMFGQYFEPNVSPAGACAIEALGTAILMLMILALTDERNPARPPPGMAPFFIGFTVATLISVLAPRTQAGFNPARDFGPRVVAALSGWGSAALPGPRSGFWVYIVGPLLGAPIGAWIYDLTVRPGLPAEATEKDEARPAAVYAALPGSWAADAALLQRVVREACATACCERDTDVCLKPVLSEAARDAHPLAGAALAASVV